MCEKYLFIRAKVLVVSQGWGRVGLLRIPSFAWLTYSSAVMGWCFAAIRAVFKWLSKVITWLRLLRLVIGLKDSRQFFNQWDAKPKPIAPCTRDFSRASSELRVIARNCDWFIALSAPVVIGRSNCFGFGFSTVIWKPLYMRKLNRGVVGWRFRAPSVTYTTQVFRPLRFTLLSFQTVLFFFFVFQSTVQDSHISLLPFVV